MRVRHTAAAAAIALSLTACSAHVGVGQPDGAVPGNVGTIQSSGIGAMLKHYGYTPAYTRYNAHGKPQGYVFVVCGSDQSNLTECNKHLKQHATSARPNLYTQGNLVIRMQGPSAHNKDVNYYADMPPALQNLGQLSPSVRDQVVGVMPQIISALKDATTYTSYHVTFMVGGKTYQTKAWKH